MTMRTFMLLLALAVLPALAETDDEDYDDLEEHPSATVLELGGSSVELPSRIDVDVSADTETGLWLQLQRSGKIAGSNYTMPGKVATLAYRRYLNSYRYPIPRQFYFYSSGSSSSGTGGGFGGGLGLGSGSGVATGR